MITKIGFKNYKAFMNGELDLRPLTFLIGANSVGKSSLIQLILMLQQTAVEANANDKSVFKLNGKNVSLGENLNVFRNKDKHNVLSLSFSMDSSTMRRLFSSVSNSFDTSIERLFIYSGADVITSIFSKEKESWKNNRDVLESILTKVRKERKGVFSRFIDYNIEDGYDDIVTAYDFIHDVKRKYSKKDLDGELIFDFKYVDSCLSKISAIKISSVTLKINEDTIVSLEIKGSKKSRTFSLTSSLYKNGAEFGSSQFTKQLNELLVNDMSNLFLFFKDLSLDFEFFVYKNSKRFSIFLWLLLSILRQAISTLSTSFGERNINYVSPLRAYPKRYYFLDRSHVSSSLDTLDGDSVTEILKEKPDLKNNVNSWLKHFGLTIDVQAIEEIIHKLRVNQDGLDLDITDVGFGISQVLPVIVQGFFANRDSLTVIEQPEVHLHPRMQADLGDLFIDIALPKTLEGKRKFSKSLLIETHSEYLLKRIRRRIAVGEIKSSDVAIYVLESGKAPRRSIIKKINIDSTGNFEWPEEFYGGELLQDTVEYLKAQTKLR